MKKTLIILFTGFMVSACSSTIHTSDGYTRTIQQNTGKVSKIAAACVEKQMKSISSSAYLRPKTADLYEGTIPGPEADRPLAKVTLDKETDRGVLADLTVYQLDPSDENITEALKECIK